MLKGSLGFILLALTACSGAPVAPSPTSIPVTADNSAQQIMLTETAAAVVDATQVAAAEQESIAARTALAAAVAPTMTAAAKQGLVVRNVDWTVVEREFDGVTMVQVPAGCFTMGSDTGKADERPVHNICFFTPFWIDKFEVRQAQFAAFGGVAASPTAFVGNNRPVEQITWFEARDYCIKRGGRLPTEAEWEYAARGPDSVVYPWGSEFIDSAAVYAGNSGRQTADVGTKPEGASWVGALDMSGNVWEWTSSLHNDYPYGADDGREADNESTRNTRRVLRGGAWSVVEPASMRMASRFIYFPVSSDASSGLRCMRTSG